MNKASLLLAALGSTILAPSVPHPCPAGAGGNAPAPKAEARRKARKQQKLARRNNRT